MVWQGGSPSEEQLAESGTALDGRVAAGGNVIGALGLGLVTGVPAGGCMGAMASEMLYILKDIKINQTELRVPIIPCAHITCMCLLGSVLATMAALVGGRQAYNLVRGDTPGKALALAAPVAVLGVAVTGAALGAGLEIYSWSLLRDKDHPVPFTDPSEFTPPVVQVLERIFIIVFGVQMFQASSGAGLYRYFVTGGAGASLGALLAVSVGAGVALCSAGDLGQRYGGHTGTSTGPLFGQCLSS
ncbi:hypothetical protein NFI96_004580, partial [Prochilodus magdalenae]